MSVCLSVKHTLASAWKTQKYYFFPAFPAFITVKELTALFQNKQNYWDYCIMGKKCWDSCNVPILSVSQDILEDSFTDSQIHSLGASPLRILLTLERSVHLQVLWDIMWILKSSSRRPGPGFSWAQPIKSRPGDLLIRAHMARQLSRQTVITSLPLVPVVPGKAHLPRLSAEPQREGLFFIPGCL